MSTHPNAILMAVLKPNDLARRTMRNILAESDHDECTIKIGGNDYDYLIMEDSYNDSFQIGAEEGDLIFFDYVTYGYGEFIEWEALEKMKEILECWAVDVSSKYNCSYKIRILANYW